MQNEWGVNLCTDINLRRRLSLSGKPGVPKDKMGSLRAQLHGYDRRLRKTGDYKGAEPLSRQVIHKRFCRGNLLCAVRAGHKIIEKRSFSTIDPERLRQINLAVSQKIRLRQNNPAVSETANQKTKTSKEYIKINIYHPLFIKSR